MVNSDGDSHCLLVTSDAKSLFSGDYSDGDTNWLVVISDGDTNWLVVTSNVDNHCFGVTNDGDSHSLVVTKVFFLLVYVTIITDTHHTFCLENCF